MKIEEIIYGNMYEMLQRPPGRHWIGIAIDPALFGTPLQARGRIRDLCNLYRFSLRKREFRIDSEVLLYGYMQGRYVYKACFWIMMPNSLRVVDEIY